MKHIDLRRDLERVKYATAKETTLYLNDKYVGFRHSKLGVAFVRLTNKGVHVHKNGRVRWYHSIESGLIDAVRYVRKVYNVNLPIKDWEVVRAKHYNTSTVEQVIEVVRATLN